MLTKSSVRRGAESLAMVLLVFGVAQGITMAFGLQVTMVLIGILAASIAIILTFGPRR